jgi:DNA mismatch endonuclease (patch repair protein)
MKPRPNSEPRATSGKAGERMARVRKTGTDIELSLRKTLFRMGLRYRVNRPVLSKPRRVADIVFPGPKVAVFVDGCFWHGCPVHATWPKTNAEFWRGKIETNRQRDADTNSRLLDMGWTVIRIWEHEDVTKAAKRIQDIIEKLKREL